MDLYLVENSWENLTPKSKGPDNSMQKSLGAIPRNKNLFKINIVITLER